MTAFERDSRLPVAAIAAGIVVGCAVTWYAVHHTLEKCGLAAFGWGGEEASVLFSTARWTIWLSAMIAAGLAFLARIVRSKDGGNGWGFVVGMTKIMLVMLLAIRLSSTCWVRNRHICAAQLRPDTASWRLASVSDGEYRRAARVDSGWIVAC